MTSGARSLGGRRCPARCPGGTIGKLAHVGLVLALILSACGAGGVEASDFSGTRDDEGNIVEASQLAVSLVRVGDCFDGDADNRTTEQAPEVSLLQAVPCAQPHDNEVYHVADLTEATFPGTDEITRAVFEACLDRFEPFVGITYERSVFDIAYMYPSEMTWAAGDRGFACAVFDATGQKAEGSAQGSSR